MSSRSQPTNGRLAFASKTAFELLASPDNNEESEEEGPEQVDPGSEGTSSQDTTVNVKRNISPSTPSLSLESPKSGPGQYVFFKKCVYFIKTC